MAKSFWSKKVCLFTDYYSRDMVAYNFSIVNLLSILVWFLIIVLPFVVAFSSGGKFIFSVVQLFVILDLW